MGVWVKHLFFILSLLLLFVACNENKPKGVADENCLTDEEFFQRSVWKQVMVDRGCRGCHDATGVAVTNHGVSWSLGNDLGLNFQVLKQVALVDLNGQSVLLLKPTLTDDTSVNPYHVGGAKIQVGSAEYNILADFVSRSKNPQVCNKVTNLGSLNGVIVNDLVDTLRKATLALVGRLPSDSEENTVFASGKEGLKTVLDSIMTEDAFYERLTEMFNDLLLTDKYFESELASDLISADYTNALWYRSVPGATVDPNDPMSNLTTLGVNLRDITERSLAREPLELINYVVKNNKPFSEILTANYTMVNAYSARSYGVNPNNVAFQDTEIANNAPTRPYNSFVPATLTQGGVAIPHAGILTSRMFMGRYPNSTTNVNRHRSRFFFLYFLDTDILTLAEQINAEDDLNTEAPTLTNSQCTSCHNVMDPVAGLFKNWTTGNRYEPREWYDTTPDVYIQYGMLAPGMSIQNKMPASRFNSSLQWLGQQTAQDTRFHRSVVNIMFEALTGQKALKLPEDSSNQALYDAFQFQNNLLETFKASFVSSGYDLKALIKEIILSTYFRAKNLNQSPSQEENDKLAAVGIGRLLTPEQLSRKVTTILGQPWQNTVDSSGIPYLLNRYKLLYGGIDSDEITQRTSVPNAVITNIQMLLSTQMACKAVPADFAILNKNDRRLFPYVEIGFEPEFPNGSPKPDAIEAIKQNIKYLHKRILAEDVPEFDAEIERTYQLFLDTYQEYKTGNLTTLHPTCRQPGAAIPIVSDPNHTIHAWMAVVAYLMQDFRFVFE